MGEFVNKTTFNIIALGNDRDHDWIDGTLCYGQVRGGRDRSKALNGGELRGWTLRRL